MSLAEYQDPQHDKIVRQAHKGQQEQPGQAVTGCGRQPVYRQSRP